MQFCIRKNLPLHAWLNSVKETQINSCEAGVWVVKDEPIIKKKIKKIMNFQEVPITCGTY